MDGLNDNDRVLAWRAIWNPSFSGIAIVNKDFTFRSANPQFCKMLGVTPAELIGQKFSDITPVSIRKLDENNARLVMQRVIESYILPKTYEFENGRKVKVVLLVRGAYSAKGEFLFFVSTIMLDNAHDTPSPAPYLKPTNILGFAKKYGRWFIGIGAAFGGIFITLIEYYSKR